MRLATLILFLAASLEASTILPGSWIEVEDQGSAIGSFSIQADDGFFITGGFEAFGPGRPVGDPDQFGRIWTGWHSYGLDAWASSVSSPWLPGDGFAAEGDTIGLEMAGPECELVAVCGSFTFYGYLDAGGAPAGSPIWPLFYEFSGQGTAYLTIGHGDHDYAQSVRYEFEAAPVPEPSTWALLLAGLLALGRRSSARVIE